jgi:hypothetical protein
MSTAYLKTKHPANHHVILDPSIEAKHQQIGGVPKLAEASASAEKIPPDIDDIFIDLRMVNQGSNERRCNGEIRRMTDELEEFELSFVYGVESSSHDVYEYTDDLENLVLDFVASTVLICAGESDTYTVPVPRSQHLAGEMRDLGVVRIRYPEYGEITTIGEFYHCS